MTETPIRSGNAIIDFLFDLCVKILLWLADLFGVSYNTINIWIFCIIWPIITAFLVVLVVRQHLRIKQLTGEIENKSGSNHRFDGQVTRG